MEVTDRYNHITEIMERVLPKQALDSWKTYGGLYIVGKSGLRYCIRWGGSSVSGPTNDYIGEICTNAKGCPRYDGVVAEYLLIKNDEKLYWQNTNHWLGINASRHPELLKLLEKT